MKTFAREKEREVCNKLYLTFAYGPGDVDAITFIRLGVELSARRVNRYMNLQIHFGMRKSANSIVVTRNANLDARGHCQQWRT